MNVPTSFIKTRGNCGELGVNLISLPNRARGYLYCSFIKGMEEAKLLY